MHARKFNSGIATVAKQRGAVLFVSLMFLVIIALLAVTSSGTSIMEERMTGGMRNRQLATMAAETALRAGERQLWTSAIVKPILSCGGFGGGVALFNVYCYSPTGMPPQIHTFRTSTNATTFGADSSFGTQLPSLPGGVDLTAPGSSADLTSKVVANPYVVYTDLGLDGGGIRQHDNREGTRKGGVPPKHLFRITARSLGGSDTVMRVLETTFAAPAQ